MKFAPIFRGTFSAFWQPPSITLAEVIVMIYVSVEMRWPVIPRPGTDKETPGEPLWPVVTIGSTIVRRDLVITVRTDGRRADPH